MAEILIKFRGKEFKVLVDDEDHRFLMRFKWHIVQHKYSQNVRYAVTVFNSGGKRINLPMQRLLCGMRKLIDHKNRNGLDNRKENLRPATQAENARNCSSRTNKTGFRGVSKTGNKFYCQLRANGLQKFSHGFATAEEAAREYDRLSLKYHKEFGVLNFPEALKPSGEGER